MPAEQLKTYPTIGVCGLDCGLCPRYYTKGRSRCPGCGGPNFSQKHPSCSFITCCVKKKGLEVCGQCEEFPCSKFKSEEEYRRVEESSSYPPYATVLSNLRFIRDNGIGKFIKVQEKRIGLLLTMIDDFDDGRSRSFFCRAAALLHPKTLQSSLAKANKAAAGKTKVLKAILADAALSEGVALTGKK